MAILAASVSVTAGVHEGTGIHCNTRSSARDGPRLLETGVGAECTYCGDAHQCSGTTCLICCGRSPSGAHCVQERLKTKCEVYWPREVGCSVVYGSIEVTLTDFTQLADYTIRSLTISKVLENLVMTGFLALCPSLQNTLCQISL